MATIYFALAHTGEIKIGRTARGPEYLPARMRQIYDDCGKRRMTVLAWISGDPVDERSLHRFFAASRAYTGSASREWFRPTPELLALIEQVRARNPACVAPTT